MRKTFTTFFVLFSVLSSAVFAQENPIAKDDVTQEEPVANDEVTQEQPVAEGEGAQEEPAVTLFGNPDQVGTKIHQAIQNLMLGGETLIASSESVIESALSEESTLLSPNAALAISKDKVSTIEFVRHMVETNSLFEATKATIENAPENIINIIEITISFYPDFAQDVINAVVMTGEMDSDEALLAAIAAGADPTTVGEATAAGGPVAVALAAPVGVGVGAGGTGGGDATASTN